MFAAEGLHKRNALAYLLGGLFRSMLGMSRHGLIVLSDVLHLPYVFFFFSSRRRHTRYWRDWSSDVCSSDLSGSYVERSTPLPRAWLAPSACSKGSITSCAAAFFFLRIVPSLLSAKHSLYRSEERRVGKEGRSRGSPYH